MKMNRLFLIGLFACLPFPLLAQSSTGADSVFLTPTQNSQWLAELKNLDMASQLAKIRTRFLQVPEPVQQTKGILNSSPILIVDGIPLIGPGDENAAFADENAPVRELLATQLTPAKVKSITVIDRMSPEVVVCKPFTGWIVLVVSDKQLKKKLEKLTEPTKKKKSESVLIAPASASPSGLIAE